MRYGILGGGFGLYGYLPAAAGLDPRQITILEDYRATIRRRPELTQFENQVKFVKTAVEVLEQSDVLIIARRPADQEKLIAELPLEGWRGRLVLEKPLARTPALALEVQQRLQSLRVEYIEGFSILETDWAKELAEIFRRQQISSLMFDWRFLAHHYHHNLDNWKRRTDEGGGALRFYSIHLIALLAGLAEWKAVRCSPLLLPNEDPRLDCLFESGSCQATVHCGTQWTGEPGFELTVLNGGQVVMHLQLANPFVMAQPGAPQSGPMQDARVIFLQRLLRRASGPTAPAGGATGNYLKLWAELERLRAGAG